MRRLYEILSREKFILAVYVLASMVIGIQHYVGGPEKYNNFLIFRAAFEHLLNGQNLHLEYPEQYFDLFLYHPSFCFLFIPFSILPIPAGLILWLVCSATILFWSIRLLPVRDRDKVFVWWFVFFEMLTSQHNQQTNTLIAAFGLLTFSCHENGKTRWAALFPLLAFCIKGYGLIYAVLFLIYPRKWQYLKYSFIWAFLLALLPVSVTGLSHFLQVYKDWFGILIADHKVNYGYSLMGVLKVWIPGFDTADVTIVQIAGISLLLITLTIYILKSAFKTLSNRLLLLSYLSLWVIVFNHAAESPTYVISITGVALYHIVNRQNPGLWSWLLIGFVFFLSILSPTDLYPASIRKNFFDVYLVKVIPCLVVYGCLQIQLLVYQHEK